MKLKWIISMTVVAMLLAVGMVALAGHDSIVAAQDEGAKLESALLDKFATEGSADFIVRFTEQADLSAAYAMDWSARGEFVYNTLRETAAKSQANAIAMLDVAGLKHQTIFTTNDLYVWNGALTNAEALAALPEVSFIRATRVYSIDPGVVQAPFANVKWAGDLLAYNMLTTAGDSTTTTVDWGITDTKADQFWTAFGKKGEGMKVANIDTGVFYTHPALINQYACQADPGNPDCWEDPSNVCGGTPCDPVGHGTHTMGTMVAKDDPSFAWIVGMAPNAQWVACLGCDLGSSCSDYALLTCGDWVVAPDGDSANRPNVVNNSWGGTPDGSTWYLDAVTAWRAAGIFPAFSAGNSGPTCGSMGDPGSYQESFASAAHSYTRAIAAFSSRGDSFFGSIPYTKPNISAPGVNIMSTVPGGGFAPNQGTSMASPHNAGAVALLWSCAPDLVGQVDQTFQVLQDNADTPPAGDCGAPPGQPGNWTYGYGYLDVLTAGEAAGCGTVQTGTLEGYVYDDKGAPVEGANVSALPEILDNQINVLTDPNGFYTMELPVGTYAVTASKLNYEPQTIPGVVVVADQITTQDFEITFLGAWTQIALDPTCPDWTRYDGEYFPATGLVYLLGGRGGATGAETFGDIFSFDPATHTCTDTGADLPTPISNYTIAPLNNGTADVLCVFGGRIADGTQTLDVQCYDPVANAATVVNQLPTEWTGFGPFANVVVDNTAYIFGGFRNTAAPYMLARTDAYNPVTNLFEQKGDLNEARSYIMGVAVDGKVYAFGGDTFDGVSLFASVKAEVLDPAVGTWDDAAVADLPVPSGEGRAYGFDSSSHYELAGKIVLAGGGEWPNQTNAVLSYDVASNTYDQTFPDLNSPRRDQAGFFVPGAPGAMWVIGGRNGADTPPFMPPEFFEVQLLEADLGVAKTAEPDPVKTESPLNYTLTISNTGPMTVTGVIVSDTLPAGVTFVGASEGCTEAGGKVRCEFAELGVDVTEVITIAVTAPDVTGVITNTVTIVGDLPDPNLANNTATVKTEVIPSIIDIYLPITQKQ